jgi:hypothetical protein
VLVPVGGIVASTLLYTITDVNTRRTVMKDCKWNPPTLGSKGLLFDDGGEAVNRERLNDIKDGSVLLKFLDESGSRSERRRAAKRVAKWQETDAYQAIIRGEAPLPKGWALHVREADNDRKDAVTVAGNILGLAAPTDPTRASVLNTPDGHAALTALIAAKRRQDHGVAFAWAHYDEQLVDLLAKNALQGDRDIAHFVSWHQKASKLTAHLEETTHTSLAALVALRARWILDEADLSNAADRDLLSVFVPDRYDRTGRIYDADWSTLNADVLVSCPSVLGEDWRPVAEAMRAFRRSSEFSQKNEFNVPQASPYVFIFERIDQLAKVAAQHELPAGSFSAHLGAPMFSSFPLDPDNKLGLRAVINESANHKDRRALALTLTVLNYVADRDEGLRLPDDLRDLEGSLSQFDAILSQVKTGIAQGRIAGPRADHALEYLHNPDTARPRASIARTTKTSSDEYQGYLSASLLGVERLDTPSEVLKALSETQRPGGGTGKDRSARSISGSTDWDGVEVSPNPSAQELVCVAALAASRAAESDLERVTEIADRIAAPATLVELARETAQSVKRDGRLSDETRARIAAVGLAHQLAADKDHPESVFGVKEFSDACQDLFSGASFSLPAEAAPATYRAAERLAAEASIGTAQLNRAELRERLSRPERGVGDALAEEATLARMRAGAGDILGVAAAPYLRPSQTGAPTSVAIALSPTTDPKTVAAAIRAQAPWATTALKVRERELLLDIETSADPVSVLEVLDAAVASVKPASPHA